MMAELDLNFVAGDVIDPRITFSRASIGTYYDSAGVLQTAATNIPRFDYDPVTHVAKGLLIEEQRINNADPTQSFDAAGWTKTGATATADQVIAPDGTLTADLITASATTATVSKVANSGNAFVNSIYTKKGTSNWFYIEGRITGTGAETPRAYFNLATGTVGTVDVGVVSLSAGIQDVGNGWYRCWIARGASASGTDVFVMGLCDADASVNVTVGRTVYLWGAQNEALATFPSSYIPGLFASTRAADVAVMTGTNFSSWYNQPAGTFVAEFDVFISSGTSGTRPITLADNNTLSEKMQLSVANNDPVATVRTGNVQQASLDVGTIAAGIVYKLGVSYAINDIAACLNGGTVGTDTTATLPTATQLRVGNDGPAANYLNGHIRRIQFWNVAKSDADLVTITDPAYVEPPIEPPVIPAGSGLVGSGAMGAFWAQDGDDRGYEASRKRRKKFLEDRARRIRAL